MTGRLVLPKFHEAGKINHAVPYRRVLSVICVVSQMLSLCNIGSNYSKQQSETTRLELVLTGGQNS